MHYYFLHSASIAVLAGRPTRRVFFGGGDGEPGADLSSVSESISSTVEGSIKVGFLPLLRATDDNSRAVKVFMESLLPLPNLSSLPACWEGETKDPISIAPDQSFLVEFPDCPDDAEPG